MERDGVMAATPLSAAYLPTFSMLLIAKQTVPGGFRIVYGALASIQTAGITGLTKNSTNPPGRMRAGYDETDQ